MYSARFVSLLFEDKRAILGVEFLPDDRSHAEIADKIDITDLDYDGAMAEINDRLLALNANASSLSRIAGMIGQSDRIRAKPKPAVESAAGEAAEPTEKPEGADGQATS